MVSDTIIVKQLADGRFQWWGYGEGSLTGEGSLDTLAGLIGSRAVTLLVDGFEVTVERVEFTAPERRHVLKTVDYLLEEQLIEDVESLHIVHADLQDTSIVLGVVSRQYFAVLLAQFEEHNIALAAVLPEPLALPFRDQSLTLAVDQSCCQLRYGVNLAATVDRSVAVYYLSQLLEQQSYHSIVCYGEEDDALLAELAAVSDETDDWQQRPLSQLRDGLPMASELNLLQGEYSPSVDWASIWSRWKLPAAIAACALLANLAVVGSQISAVNGKLAALDQQEETLFKEVFPRGRYTGSARRRFESELKGAGGGSGPFVPLLATIAEPISKDKTVTIKSLSYEASSREVSTSIVADKFSQLEKLVAEAEERGLQAELLSSNNRDGKVAARMKFKEL
ncbi:type II secretion system protein L (GspL) [Sinobacterium caligoides]|uniref:Type II secretion system protein L n=1 Tax=Sinobacterium caligoides TaxID=933926 RepID=A0A3N2DNS0_9GAMM|nr:type II secretion system protein GspL [Sinobacterium caligoides]ROS01342.1 type II secretion system protein L (GspL) [Sinobacterium caligoides]